MKRTHGDINGNLRNSFLLSSSILHGFFICMFCLASLPLAAATVVTDDAGNKVTMSKPARRIITLAPFLTELVYAAGAGQWVVGTVTHSDYPAAAKNLPRVGDYPVLDLEAIVALQPDLVLAWESGSPRARVEKLRQLGLTVWSSEPQHLPDIADTLERLGRLAGTEVTAHAAAQDFLRRYRELQKRYSNRHKLRVFYQLWDTPLMTVNGKQLISDVMHLCGAENVFADLPALAPTVTQEAVLAMRPEVIIAGGAPETHGHWWEVWRRWPSLPAVEAEQLYFIPGDLLHRHGPRILDGAARMCHVIDQARDKQNKTSSK